MDIKCRCCLASNLGIYHSLLSVLPDFGKNGSSVLDILRLVTSSQVNFSDDLPSEICQGCLGKLKTAFGFIVVFKNSQLFLQKDLDLKLTDENEDNFETIIIKAGENEEVFEDSTPSERIVIVKDDENVERNFEEIFGEHVYSIVDEDGEPIVPETVDQTVSIRLDDRAKVDMLSGEGPNELDMANNVDEENISYEESMVEDVEIRDADLSNGEDNSEYFDQDFKKELLEMEKNRERNKNNIIIMTIEDVLKVEKRKSSEKKLVLSVEDILNTEKKTRTRQDQAIGVFICDVCDRVFNTRRNLVLHKYRLHNPNWKEKFKCSVCGKECKTFSMLRHHMLKHTDRKYGCHLCGKEYMVKQHLIMHIKSKHDKTFQNKYLCPLCGKSFKSSSALTYHLRIHNNQRNYMCRYCGFKSLTLSAMKRHERVHTGERPFNCRYCDKTFAGTAERQKHENIHNGIMPYKCRYCDKRFVQPYNMKVHMLQHSGDNVCHFCNKNFIGVDVLKFHYQRTHKVTIEGDENLDAESE